MACNCHMCGILLMTRPVHYNYIEEKYDHKAKLLLTDTDSCIKLTNETETNDVKKDFYVNKYIFDFSEYPIQDLMV